VRGLALPSARAFATPLGTIAVDDHAVRAVEDMPQVVKSDAAHAHEHSLEVQLPFLQKMLGQFTIVPFAVGMASVQEVAEVLERLWGGPETLIVISSDLSHYHAYDDARRIDGVTIARIASFATDLDHEEACGATPLNGLLALAPRKNLSIKLLAACNSGDTAGGKGQVVGYSAFGLHEGGEVPLDHAGKILLWLARGAIEASLSGHVQTTPAQSWLQQAGATFVTLTKDGALRGCIGSLEAVRPLAQDVIENARAAAQRDPRFPPIGAHEWPQCRVEVSLLSAPKPIRFADEADLLEQIRPGEDGLIVEAQGRRATYLPQVWEVIADKRQFLEELKRKAGIAGDTRIAACRVSRYRVMKWTETATR
jgi:MEMO1 family protein